MDLLGFSSAAVEPAQLAAEVFSPSGLLFTLLLQSLAMGITIFFIPRIWVTSIFGAVMLVGSLALINSTLWDPALFQAIPTTTSARAIELFLVNGVLFWILVKILPGVEMRGFLPAFAAPIIFSVVSVVVQTKGREVDWLTLWERGVNSVQDYRDQVRDSELE